MGTIIMILIGIPIAIALFSILRTKVDPDYKERMDNATKVRKELRRRGLSDPMIDDEVRRRDYIFKNEQKNKRFRESITKDLLEEDNDLPEAINNSETSVHKKGIDAYKDRWEVSLNDANDAIAKGSKLLTKIEAKIAATDIGEKPKKYQRLLDLKEETLAELDRQDKLMNVLRKKLYKK